MKLMYLIVLIFSALTLYFTYGEYRQGRFSKKAFKFVSGFEAIVIAAAATLLIMGFDYLHE